MCGVIGMATSEPRAEHQALLRRLFVESRVRGIHAFGFSFWDGESVVTRRFLSVKDCVEAVPRGITRLIGHCRYSTSGDHRTPANNQPIQIGQAALAFNGVVSMASKAEYERQYDRRYATENDGEIVLDKLIRGDDWRRFVADGRFSFAGLALERDRLTAIRNVRRPLYRCNREGAVFFASTADIFRRAGFDSGVESVPPGVADHAD